MDGVSRAVLVRLVGPLTRYGVRPKMLPVSPPEREIVMGKGGWHALVVGVAATALGLSALAQQARGGDGASPIGGTAPWYVPAPPAPGKGPPNLTPSVTPEVPNAMDPNIARLDRIALTDEILREAEAVITSDPLLSPLLPDPGVRFDLNGSYTDSSTGVPLPIGVVGDVTFNGPKVVDGLFPITGARFGDRGFAERDAPPHSHGQFIENNR